MNPKKSVLSINSFRLCVLVLFFLLGASHGYAQTIVDNTAANFSAGTLDPNTYISQTVDGEVILAPTVGAEFSGTILPAGWFSTPWATGGSASVGTGLVTVDGDLLGTNNLYLIGSGRSLEFVATFSGAAYQHVGFGVSYGGPPWAIFSTASGGGSLYTRTNNGSTVTDTPIPGSWLGSPHRYRIDWNASNIVFSIDGTVVATHAVSFSGFNMRPLVSDYNVGGGAVSVDWMRMSPYPGSGTFVSRVFDAGSTVNWGTALWTSSTPAGTTLGISVRLGNTPVPDGTWTAFTSIASSGAAISGNSRYLQYRAVLTSTDPGQTPALNDITFTSVNGSSPSITSLSPTSGPVGTVVTTTGSNFGASQVTGSTVTFNGIAATPTSWSATSITAPVPVGATTGPVVVTVGGVASAGVTFTVGIQAPNGTITSPAGNVTIAAGGMVNFAGTGTDPDNNTPLSYLWNFGAGSGIGNSTGQNPGTVQFNNPGTFVVTFTVTDSTGLADPTPATRTITVQGASVNLIPKTPSWTVVWVDSEEVVGEGPATHSFDDNVNTFWSSVITGANPVPGPPHEIQIDLGAVYDVSGFRYLPRQDGWPNGRIGQYEFYVSSVLKPNGTVNCGTAVATGMFANTVQEKQVLFTPQPGRYVCLVAKTNISGDPYTNVAELNVLQADTTPNNQPPDGLISSPTGNATIVVGSAINFTGSGSDPNGNLPLSYRWSFGAGSGIPDSTEKDPGLVQFNMPGTFLVTFTVADAHGLVDPTPATRTITVTSGSGAGQPIPKSNWTLHFVDSQEVLGGDYRGLKAFDNDSGTFWHTQSVNSQPVPPHEIQINLGTVYNVSGFSYLPGNPDGRIEDYEFYVSLDGANWGSPVATGTSSGFFADTAVKKDVSFAPKPGQYVRLRALTEVNGQPYTSMAELDVLESGACIPPSVNLIRPQSFYLQPSGDLYVSAYACLNPLEGIRFVLDGGSAAGGTEYDDYSVPHEVTFTGLGKFEHMIDTKVIDTGGAEVPGIATYDQAIQVGIGDYYVAMGDSITAGVGDDQPDDDNSQDGRNTSGGYTPILDDLLTAATGGRPHTVVDEAVPGTRSADGLALITTLLQKHPNAQWFLIMYGTNDSGLPVPSGQGLQPGSPGYPGSFKDNMQGIINAINAAGKVAILAKAPVALPLNGTLDNMVQQYNFVIQELKDDPANNIPVEPPDFHDYFANNPGEYADADTLHPNGIGYQSMANLWRDQLMLIYP